MHRPRSIIPALVVGVGVTAALIVPATLPWSAAAEPAFPQTVGAYSWWTTPLAPGDLERATIVYQNGVGVEFMDSPQAVILGADGSTYRRLSAAEGRSTAADQGDPARSVLSPDGTFALVGSGVHTGLVTVVDLATGAARDLPIGDERAAVPQSIAADGRTALLLTGDAPMSRYEDMNFALNGALITLDLRTGEVLELPTGSGTHAAAISPDGRLVLFGDESGFALLDVASGAVGHRSDVRSGDAIGGSSFSPSSEFFATSNGVEVSIHTVMPGGRTRSWPMAGFEYAYPVGWRDDGTVLVQGSTSGDNAAAFAWVDATTGAIDVFSTYTPDGTGAAMWVSSVAADLVPQWTIADRPNDRGLIPTLIAVGLGAGAGIVAWFLTPRRRGKADQDAGAPAVGADERVPV